MITITAMLAWYEEDAQLLEECILSLAGLCDRLVAVDGGYELIPGAGASSGAEQHKTVKRAAKKAGLDLDLFVPPAAWSGQVAKRDWMIKRATYGWQTMPDWLLVIDADYRVRCDPQVVRTELEKSPTTDVAECDFFTPVPDGFDLDASPHEWHTRHASTTFKHSFFYRAHPEPRLEERHWYYSAIKDGVRVGMLGCPDYPSAVTRPLTAEMTIDHRCFERSTLTLERNRDYINARTEYLDAHGVEDGVLVA